MSILQTPPELLYVFFGIDDASLEEIIVISRVCRDFRRLIFNLDDTLVKRKVLQRVPWMQIGQIGTGIVTWFDAARLVAARKHSIDHEMWWDPSEIDREDLRDIFSQVEYNHCTSVEIKGRNLPRSFKPMFEAEIPTSCGGVIGKYMEEKVEDSKNTRFMDLTTLEYSDTVPYVAAKPSFWSSNLYVGVDEEHGEYATYLPLSKILLVNKGGRFHLLQESERWVVVHTKPDNGKGLMKFILDKTKCTEEKGEKVLYFNSDSQECGVRAYECAFDIHVHLLHGSAGAIILDLSSDLTVFYEDLFSPEKTRRQLVCLPEYYDWWYEEKFRFPDYAEDNVRSRGTSRKLVVTYGGMLYVHFREFALIPLWVDLTKTGRKSAYQPKPHLPCTAAFGGIRFGMKPMFLGPENNEPSEKRTCGIVHSADGRWITQTVTGGATVVDLVEKKTYTVDKGDDPSSTCIFVGLNDEGDKPVFYEVHMARGQTRDTGCYLKYRQDNPQVIARKSTMLRTIHPKYLWWWHQHFYLSHPIIRSAKLSQDT